MKLDLLFEIQPIPALWAQPYPDGPRAAEHEAYERTFEQVLAADQLGFQTAWFVEHHLREHMSACPCPEAVLGGLARSTHNLRLGFGVVQMPHGFQHPTRVAEKVSTVDIMSHGRVEWGTGRSTTTEQTWFGVPTDERSTQHWREAVEFVVHAWDQQRMSLDGGAVMTPGRALGPKPYQRPHPPPWLGCGSASSAQLAGVSGMGMLLFPISESVEQTAETVGVFRQAHAECETPLTQVRNDRSGAFTLVHCAEDMDEAARYGVWDSASWWFKTLANWVLDGVQYMPPQRQETMRSTLEALRDGVDVERAAAEGRIVIGTPDECLDKMMALSEAGIDQLLCYTEFGSMPQKKVLRSLELLGTEVIPKLEKAGHRFDFDSLSPAL